MTNTCSVLLVIRDKSSTQADVAYVYYKVMQEWGDAANWPVINAAIMDRWKGKTSLRRIKKMAWEFYERPFTTPK